MYRVRSARPNFNAAAWFAAPDPVKGSPMNSFSTLCLVILCTFYVVRPSGTTSIAKSAPESLIHASLDPAKILGVIDDHRANSTDVAHDGANWRGYRIEFAVPASREWKVWTGKDRNPLEQPAFAELIEGFSGVVEAAAPRAACDQKSTTVTWIGEVSPRRVFSVAILVISIKLALRAISSSSGEPPEPNTSARHSWVT
jgi:hypothetical protein